MCNWRLIIAQKIFVSYKYADSDVAPFYVNALFNLTTTVRDYVDEFVRLTTNKGLIIYKGEKDDEDLSMFKEETIWSSLKERIFDSSLTVVLISPNMRESWKADRDQWIPWEVSYSLRKQTRNGRTSQTNALLFIVLPDRNGEYGYRMYMNDFGIIDRNIKNGYALVVRWHEFINNVEQYIMMANNNRYNIPEYIISKTV